MKTLREVIESWYDRIGGFEGKLLIDELDLWLAEHDRRIRDEEAEWCLKLWNDGDCRDIKGAIRARIAGRGKDA